MPKMKTKSGAIKRSNEQIRNLRGTQVLSDSETRRIRRWMPYAG
jgi:ribosomal protein L35